FLFAVFAWLARYAWIRTRWPLGFILPVALGATEFAYPLLFQSYTGVALMPLRPVIQIADLGGPLALGMLVAAVNGAVADWLLWRSNRTGRIPVFSSASALLLLAAAFVYGSWRIAGVEKLERQAEQVVVGLAQPNVGEVELHYNPRASVR